MARARAQKPKKGKSEQDGHLRKPSVDGIADPRKELLNLQQKVGNQAVSALFGDKLPDHVQDVMRSPGRPLDPKIRVEMEGRFGEDFDDVRLHTDSKAAESAQELKASAYTVGKDIAFRESRYAPDTSEGKMLLAHELAHVVQQRLAGGQPRQSRALNEPGDNWEQAADAAAKGEAEIGLPSGAPAALQRQEDDDDADLDMSSGIFRPRPGVLPSGLDELDDRNVDRFQFLVTEIREVSTAIKKQNRRTRQVMRRLLGVKRKK